MGSCLKDFRFSFSLSILLFSSPCFPLSLNSNFVHVSSSAQSSYVEYKPFQNHFKNEQMKLQENLHKYDAKCEGIFSFYTSSNSIAPKIVTKKDNMVFLYTDDNKLQPLGFFISPNNKDLHLMENSVVEGKLLLGFKNKAHEPVAFIQDNNGVVYSVTRQSKQHYSIQSLGILANNS